MAPSIDGRSMELEVKHKDSGSWHPCRASLSSGDSNVVIIVNFDNCDEEDIISSREDALARLRFRSTPLQGSECSQIKEGDIVLAMCKDQFKSKFFNAVIEKLNRVKHSNRVFCRCTFEIKWLDPKLEEGTVTIPSKSIMKLSGEEIKKNDIFAAFLDALSPKDDVASPSSPFHEEADCETDLDGMLEKQIEEISKFVDGTMESSADLVGIKRAKLGRGKQNKTAASLTVTMDRHQNSFRRSTRSQIEEQAKTVPKKEIEGEKTFLSPLAARAAFASLLHGQDSSLKQELPFSHTDIVEHSLIQNDPKPHSPNLGYGQDEHADTIRPSKRKAVEKITKSKESPYMKKQPQATGESEGEKSTVVNKLIDPIELAKSGSWSTTTSRVTRSSMNKETVSVFSGEVKVGSSSKKLTTVNSTRKTRSLVLKEQEPSPDDVKQGSSGPVNSTRFARAKIQKEQLECEESSSTIVNNSTVSSSKVTRSSVNKQTEPSSDGEKLTPLIGRSTRSRIQKEKIDTDEESQSNEEIPISSPLDPNIVSSQEMKKRTRASHSATVSSEDPSVILEDSKNASCVNKNIKKHNTISPKNAVLRSSPRLNNLSPKTRAQKQS